MAISGTFAAGEEQNWNDAAIYVDQTPASSSFILVTSWATNVRVSGGDVQRSQFNTYTVPLTFIGEQNAYTVEIDFVYTEDAATDPFKEIYDDYAASPGLLYDARWQPAGTTTGDLRFTTSGGRLVNCTIPTQPAGDGSPVIFTCQFVASAITLDTVPV